MRLDSSGGAGRGRAGGVRHASWLWGSLLRGSTRETLACGSAGGRALGVASHAEGCPFSISGSRLPHWRVRHGRLSDGIGGPTGATPGQGAHEYEARLLPSGREAAGQGGRSGMSVAPAPLGSLRSPRRAGAMRSGHFMCFGNRTLYLLPTPSCATRCAPSFFQVEFKAVRTSPGPPRGGEALDATPVVSPTTL